jgi:acyl-CoA reductase-like NAD-dependent aldehyde dehydrogenase
LQFVAELFTGVAAVDSDEEAIRMMNDSPYGLTAAVYTTDIERAKAMAPKLETGTVFMNRLD